MARKRVDWTDFEQAQVYSAVVDLLKAKKIATPVEPGKNGALFMNVMREAQVVLPDKRRRPLANVDALPPATPLAKRFMDNGIIPKDYYFSYRRRATKKAGVPEEAPDPRDQEIVDLRNQLDAAQTGIREFQALAEQLRGRVLELENQPSPMQVMQRAIAETLAMALQMHEDRKKPDFMRPEPPVERRKEELPAFEIERRKSGGVPEQPATPRLPKILIAGGVSPEKIQAVTKPFEGKVRFTTWRDESYDMLEARAKGADMTFALMGAISHDAVAIIMRSTRFYQRVANYSDNHLRNLIQNWLDKEWQS